MIKLIKFLFIYFLFVFSTVAFASQLNIYVDKDVASEGDVISLTIEYDGDAKDTPDLSRLKKDFDIVSNSSSQKISFINGDVSQIKKWVVGLIPLHTGTINIAPLKLGGLTSNTLTLKIEELSDVAYIPDSRGNNNSPYFQIEQSFEPKTPYVQQQVLLVVNVYDSIGLQNGSLSISEESQKDWAIISLLKQPITKQEIINNKKINVETYALAVFPQRSGELKLPQITFNGYYIKNSDFGFPAFNDDLNVFGINLHDAFGQQVPVKMKTKKEILTVLPIPSYYKGGDWLPLSDLKISSNWTVKKGFMVGEAVSRTINVEATGMTKNTFPSIHFEDADGFKQYPEAPVISEDILQGQLVTKAQINNVYIPTKAGNLTIPETKINWFNVKTKQVETTVIPKETILVLPNPSLESQEKTVTTENNTIESPQKITEKQEEPAKFKEESINITEIIKKPLLLLPALIFLLFLSLIYFMARHKKQNKLKDCVIKSIKKHDYKATKEALLIWANAKFYPADINNFRDISDFAKDKEFSEQLSALNKILYAKEADYFNISKFIEIFKKVNKMKVKDEKISEILPNLYK